MISVMLESSLPLPLTFSPPLCCSRLVLSSMQTTGRITFRLRTTKTVRCKCLFLLSPPPLRTLLSRRLYVLVVGLSASCLPLFTTTHPTSRPARHSPSTSIFTASNQISSSRLPLCALLRPPPAGSRCCRTARRRR